MLYMISSILRVLFVLRGNVIYSTLHCGTIVAQAVTFARMRGDAVGSVVSRGEEPSSDFTGGYARVLSNKDIAI